jgi:DNA-binding XRE family transcriptional regulator
MKYSIKELRARKRITQKEAAKLLGISTQSYNRWENDFGVVKVRDAIGVANLYGVSLNDIFFAELLEFDASATTMCAIEEDDGEPDPGQPRGKRCKSLEEAYALRYEETGEDPLGKFTQPEEQS